MRVTLHQRAVELGAGVTSLRKTIRELDLVTVCEDAGCPNLSECWADGTATFMVLGDTCTRGCRFCAVKTHSQGVPVDAEEPEPAEQLPASQEAAEARGPREVEAVHEQSRPYHAG